MATTTRVVAIGNSVGVILPREMLALLNVQAGDTLYITETPAGLQLSPWAEGFDVKTEVAGSVIRRYRDAFKKLAE
jgi:putative addiction module antidote